MSTREQISPEDFNQVVEASFQATGLTLNPTSLVTAQFDGIHMATAEDSTGMFDMEVNRRNHIQSGKPDLYMRNDVFPAFGWRGMLSQRMGCIQVETPPKRGNPEPVQHVVEVETITSPTAVNSLMLALGRRPGEDAFRLVRHDDYSDFPAGIWLEWIPEKIIPVAGLTDWLYASHDIRPRDHVQSWMATPEGPTDQIASQASAVRDRFGQEIHAAEGVRPQEVDAFVQAVDDLEGFTEPIMRVVGSLANLADVDASEQLQDLDNLVAYGTVDGCSGYVVRSRINMLRTLGLLKGESAAEAHAQRSQITAEFIGHTAGLFINLEEIQPLEDDTASQRDSRIALLRSLQTRYFD